MLHFTSDLHYNHDNIIRYCKRPWSVEEQNQLLIKKWNSRVGVKDTVYHLGDLFFYMSFDEMVAILSRLNGKKHLIIGNHDKQHEHKKFLEVPSTNVKEVEHMIELKINKQLYVMSHYPIESWNKMGGGSYHLHGHCHGSMPPRGLRLDVGIDNHPNHSIFTINEVNQYMHNLKIQEN